VVVVVVKVMMVMVEMVYLTSSFTQLIHSIHTSLDIRKARYCK
jgi:hypothetical protein